MIKERTKAPVASLLVLGLPLLAVVGEPGSAYAQFESNLTPYIPTEWAPQDQTLGIQLESSHQPVPDELFDGCVKSSEPAAALRFAFLARNDGFAPLRPGVHPLGYPAACQSSVPMVERSPCPPIDAAACAAANDDPVWVWQTSHCHWHRRDFGRYSLFNATTKANVVSGGKFSFDLQPSARYRPDAVKDPEGLIQGGWEDIYENNLLCQLLPLPNDLAPGSYNLVAEVNYDGRLTDDARMFDNAYAVRVRVEGGVAVPEPAVWSPTRSLVVPATNKKGVTVVSRAPNQYDLFYVGADGLLYLKHQENGVWGPAVALTNAATPYTLTGAPAALARRGAIEVFARATDGRIFRFYASGESVTDAASWSYHPVAGSTAAGSPVAQNSDFYRRMLVWLTPTGALQYQTNDGFAWSSVATLAGSTYPLDQTPALAATGSKAFQLFLRNSSGQVVHNRYIMQTGWSGWTNIGGAVRGSLSATSAYLDRVDVFARGSDDQLLHKAWQGEVNNPNAPILFAATWQNEGNVFDLRSDPTAIATGASAFDVVFHAGGTATSAPVYKRLPFKRRFENYMVEATPLVDYAPQPVEEIGALPGVATTVPVIAASWADGVLDVFVEYGFSGAVYVHSRR